MSRKLKRILSIVVGFIAGVWFLIYGTREFVHSKQLATRGKAVTGKVLEGEDRESRKLHLHTYYLQVMFQPENSSERSERIRVSEATFNSVQVGSSIQVHFLAEDPSVCQAGEQVELRYGNILWGLVVLGGAVFLIFYKQPLAESEAVARIGERVKTLSLDKFEYVSVKAGDFKHLDLEFYNELQRHLESLGFVYLDDQENVTLRQRSGVHTFLRILLGADKATMATIYQFIRKSSMQAPGGKSSKVLDLETWFSDGCFVTTSNAEMAGKLDSPPSISALHMRADTTWDVLLETHGRRIAEHLQIHGETKAVQLGGMPDVRRAQAEMQRTKAEFRKRAGLSKAELQRIGGSGVNVDRLHDALTERRERGD